VSTNFKGLFGLATNATVAVGQRTGQRSNHFRRAAAAVLPKLVADLVGRLPADAFIRVVEAVDQRAHDLGIAHAIKAVTQIMDGTPAILRIAGRLSLVDQLGNFAGIGVAAGSATAVATGVAAGIAADVATLRSATRKRSGAPGCRRHSTGCRSRC